MLLTFETQRIRSLCESGGAAAKTFGADSAIAIRNRLADLRAAEGLDELVACNLRESPNYPGHLEIDIGPELKLVFMAFSDDLRAIGVENGRQATRVKLVAIVGSRDV